MKNIKLFMLPAAAAILLSFSACYNDKADILYPQQACKLDTITFSNTIQPIVNAKCAITSCHDAASAEAGYDLSSYSGVAQAVTDGSLLPSLNHESGYSPMPKNADKLPTCNISQITRWVSEGSNDN